MNAYREHASPDPSKIEAAHDYALVANRRPSLGSAVSLWAFLTFVLGPLLAALLDIDRGASTLVSAMAAFTIVWPIWAKLASEPRSATERYERDLEQKVAVAEQRAISRAAPRRSIAQHGSGS